MQTHHLIGHPPTVTGVPKLAELIDHLGTPSFPSLLFRSTYEWVRADHLTAFAIQPGEPPRPIFAENVGSKPVAREVADRYCRDYWRHDLANHALAHASITSPGRWIVHTTASEIAHSEYRVCCYTAISLDTRVSLSDTQGGQILRINFYRTHGNPFSKEETTRIGEAAHLLLALVRRHADQSSLSRKKVDCYERLAATAPSLTRREAQVCAGIIRGLTSEGIALELGIGLNSVLTYKKRAYARLRISSQNQLMRLVLS